MQKLNEDSFCASKQDHIDAERWRVFYENCEAQLMGDTETSVLFQVSVGISFDHQSLLEAVDAAVAAKKLKRD